MQYATEISSNYNFQVSQGSAETHLGRGGKSLQRTCSCPLAPPKSFDILALYKSDYYYYYYYYYVQNILENE